jgi:biopolymer transport protein ExbD
VSADKKTVHPNINKPGKVLLHHIPLRFVTDKVAGGGKKAMNQEIPLIPFIDFLITLVVFLLMSFSASGELVQQQADITMPTAVNATDLEEAPVIAIDKRVITVAGNRVADTSTLLSTPQLERIEPMIQALEQRKRNWDTIYAGSGKQFPGVVIVQADQDIDYLAVKKVMFSSAQAGYANVSFAVNKGSD